MSVPNSEVYIPGPRSFRYQGSSSALAAERADAEVNGDEGGVQGSSRPVACGVHRGVVLFRPRGRIRGLGDEPSPA